MEPYDYSLDIIIADGDGGLEATLDQELTSEETTGRIDAGTLAIDRDPNADVGGQPSADRSQR